MLKGKTHLEKRVAQYKIFRNSEVNASEFLKISEENLLDTDCNE